MRRILGRAIRPPSYGVIALFNGLVTDVSVCASSSVITTHVIDGALPLRVQLRGCSSSSFPEGSQDGAGHADPTVFISALRHVVAELPANGLRLVDLTDRLTVALDADGKGAAESVVDPRTYGFSSILEALVTVNDSHYISDDFIIPCDWERILSQVRAKLPTSGVLEPAFIRYINAEGCHRFKRSSNQAQNDHENPDDTLGQDDGRPSRSQAIKAFKDMLRRENPTGSSLPGVSIHEWVKTHFSKQIEVVDVTPQSAIRRSESQGLAPHRTYMYRPIDDVHPFVNVLRTAFKCLGCTNPQHMPVAVPLQDVAAIVPILPVNPKTGSAYSWPEFLQIPEVADHFETKVSVFVSEQKASQTQIIFIDGTTLHPDEAEAAVHQWRARRSKELGGFPVKVEVVVARREDDPAHTSDDIIVDGYVIEPSHAIAARLSLISDTGSLNSEVYRTIGGHGAPKRVLAEESAPSGSGWSSVPVASDPSQDADSEMSSLGNTSVAKALAYPEDDVEISVATELRAQMMGSAPEKEAASMNSENGEPNETTSFASIEDTKSSFHNTEESPTGTPSLPNVGTLSFPILPSTCAPEVVVLVGSRDSKETIDAALADFNAKRHWVRTLLVVGE